MPSSSSSSSANKCNMHTCCTSVSSLLVSLRYFWLRCQTEGEVGGNRGGLVGQTIGESATKVGHLLSHQNWTQPNMHSPITANLDNGHKWQSWVIWWTGLDMRQFPTCICCISNQIKTQGILHSTAGAQMHNCASLALCWHHIYKRQQPISWCDSGVPG